MNYEYLSLESAENLHKSKKAQADNKKLKTDNELYKHLYEIEIKRNIELQEIINKAIEYVKNNWYSKNTRNIDELHSLGDWRLDLYNILQGGEE